MPASSNRRLVASIVTLVLGCGARSSLLDETALIGDGDGGSGAGSLATSSTLAGPPTSSQATGAGGDCTARNLDFDSPGALRLVTEGEIVFYTTADAEVMRGDLETGEERALATGRMSLGDLAIWDGYLYFSDFSSISRVPLQGGEPTVVVDLPSTTYSLAIDATGLYWAEGPSSLAFHTIERRTWDGARTTLARDVQFPVGLSVGPAGLVYTDPYDLTAPAGTVRSVPLAGGPSVVLADTLPYPELPFQRDGFVYWMEAIDREGTNFGGIARILPGARDRERVFSLGRQYPVHWATDGAHYFATVLDEATDSQLVAGGYPVGSGQTEIADGGRDAFFTMVATTPKRLVWTAQRSKEDSPRLDGIRSLCLDAIPFL